MLQVVQDTVVANGLLSECWSKLIKNTNEKKNTIYEHRYVDIILVK